MKNSAAAEKNLNPILTYPKTVPNGHRIQRLTEEEAAEGGGGDWHEEVEKDSARRGCEDAQRHYSVNCP